MVAASWLLPRIGSRRVVQIALVGYCAAGPLIGLSGQVVALAGALLVWGAFQGTLDVAMNTQAIAVERAQHRPLMSGLHGSWSIGSFAGAGIGVLAVAAGISLSVQLLVLGTAGLLAVGLLTTRMLPDRTSDVAVEEAPGPASTGSASSGSASRWSGGMVLLGAIAFAGMLCEGAAADWHRSTCPDRCTPAAPSPASATRPSPPRWSPSGCPAIGCSPATVPTACYRPLRPLPQGDSRSRWSPGTSLPP
jgi:MFS family permease